MDAVKEAPANKIQVFWSKAKNIICISVHLQENIQC